MNSKLNATLKLHKLPSFLAADLPIYFLGSLQSNGARKVVDVDLPKYIDLHEKGDKTVF
jgi:hypothetical protein